jgi:hypothetical protein
VVRDQVRDKLAFAFEDMSEEQVKNIARPVRARRIRFDSTAAASPAAPGESNYIEGWLINALNTLRDESLTKKDNPLI